MNVVEEAKYPLVLIEWEDHVGDAGWHTEDSLKDMEPVTAYTLGWLVSKRGKSYKVADTLLDDGGFGGVSTILKVCVVKFSEVDLS